jgi:hypothetical protein
MPAKKSHRNNAADAVASVADVSQDRASVAGSPTNTGGSTNFTAVAAVTTVTSAAPPIPVAAEAGDGGGVPNKGPEGAAPPAKVQAVLCRVVSHDPAKQTALVTLLQAGFNPVDATIVNIKTLDDLGNLPSVATITQIKEKTPTFSIHTMSAPYDDDDDDDDDDNSSAGRITLVTADTAEAVEKWIRRGVSRDSVLYVKYPMAATLVDAGLSNYSVEISAVPKASSLPSLGGHADVPLFRAFVPPASVFKDIKHPVTNSIGYVHRELDDDDNDGLDDHEPADPVRTRCATSAGANEVVFSPLILRWQIAKQDGDSESIPQVLSTQGSPLAMAPATLVENRRKGIPDPPTLLRFYFNSASGAPRVPPITVTLAQRTPHMKYADVLTFEEGESTSLWGRMGSLGILVKPSNRWLMLNQVTHEKGTSDILLSHLKLFSRQVDLAVERMDEALDAVPFPAGGNISREYEIAMANHVLRRPPPGAAPVAADPVVAAAGAAPPAAVDPRRGIVARRVAAANAAQASVIASVVSPSVPDNILSFMGVLGAKDDYTTSLPETSFVSESGHRHALHDATIFNVVHQREGDETFEIRTFTVEALRNHARRGQPPKPPVKDPFEQEPVRVTASVVRHMLQVYGGLVHGRYQTVYGDNFDCRGIGLCPAPPPGPVQAPPPP